MDGNGADEYMIFYVRSDISEYGYIDNRWTAAIVEPVSGGYVFSDSFRFGFNWEHVGEYSILLVNGKNGMRIVDGSIGYWDDEGGGIFSTFFGYDGSSVYIDLFFDTATDSAAYSLAGRIDEDQLEQAIALCDKYKYSDEVPTGDAISNLELFFPNRTSDGFGTLYNFGYDPPRECRWNT